MLGFGLLALVGVGVALSMGSDDDDLDIQQGADASEDEDLANYQDGDKSQTVADLATKASQNAEPDDVAQIEAFMAELEANPTEDMIQSFQDFIKSLGLTADGADGEPVDDGDDDTADDTPDGAVPEEDRPPMGDAYVDPVKVADALEAQRIADELAAEEARKPENLVTVTDANGEEVPDETVLAETTSEEVYSVTAPEDGNAIEVGYDHERLFDITYNANTTSVVAGLNTNIQGPEGDIQTETTSHTADDGTAYDTLVSSVTYPGSTEISLNVTDNQIGENIAEVDLRNPADSLHFEMSPDVGGNLHLVTHEVEVSQSEGESTTASVAYVIWTPEGLDTVTSLQVAQAISDESQSADGIAVLAEIGLGAESITLGESGPDGEAYTDEIENFINDAPKITANVGWASQFTFDPQAAADAAQQGNDGTGDEDDDLASLFESIGLNPGFFGI